MTQEEKELLLKDLCARLPYGVRVHLVYDDDVSYEREMGIGSLHDIMFDNVVDAKPYLRPMSSMTDEERRFLLKFGTFVLLSKMKNFYLEENSSRISWWFTDEQIERVAENAIGKIERSWRSEEVKGRMIEEIRSLIKRYNEFRNEQRDRL